MKNKDKNYKVHVIVNSSVLTLFVENEGVFTINNKHLNKAKIFKFLNLDINRSKKKIAPIVINQSQLNNLINLIDAKRSIESDGFTIEDDNSIKYKNKIIDDVLADKVRNLIMKGKSVTYLSKFIDKLYDSPDNIQKQLFRFLENGNFVITEEGNFIAYKYVNKNYTDCYTNTMDNSPGSVVKMNRKDCDSNPYNTCSRGLHACSYGYVKSSISHNKAIVLVEIDPGDVVSIPIDYNNSKLRCCKYRVLKDITDKFSNNMDGNDTHDILSTVDEKHELDSDSEQLLSIFKNDKRLSKRINSMISKGKSTIDIVESCFKARPKNVKAIEIYKKYNKI